MPLAGRVEVTRGQRKVAYGQLTLDRDLLLIDVMRVRRHQSAWGRLQQETHLRMSTVMMQYPQPESEADRRFVASIAPVLEIF